MRKRQRGNCVDIGNELGPRKDACRESWKSATFTLELVQFEAQDESLHEHHNWQPLDYVEAIK